MLKEAQKIASDSLTCPKGGASCVPLWLPVGNMIQMTYAHYAFLALMNRLVLGYEMHKCSCRAL